MKHSCGLPRLGDSPVWTLFATARKIPQAPAALSLVFLLLCLWSVQGSAEESAAEYSRRYNAAIADPSLGDAESAGQRLFRQRCSACHLGVPPKFETLGPFLDKDLIERRSDSTVRDWILNGSANMPGWRYALDGTQISSIIAYLKTVTHPGLPPPVVK